MDEFSKIKVVIENQKNEIKKLSEKLEIAKSEIKKNELFSNFLFSVIKVFQFRNIWKHFNSTQILVVNFSFNFPTRRSNHVFHHQSYKGCIFFLFYQNILNNQIYLSQDYQVNENVHKSKVNIRIDVDEQGNMIDYVWLIILSYRVVYTTLWFLFF